MKIFTYNDYIKAIHTLKLNEVFKFAEESASYNIKENNEKKRKRVTKEDRFIKELSKNEEEMANFINTYLPFSKKISGKDLKIYENQNILQKFKPKEPKAIYKMEKNETFLVVEYLKEQDDKAPYRVLNFCVEIIYEWSKTARFKKITQYPKVVPIVIYVGKQKWNINKLGKRSQNSIEELENYETNYETNFEYNLIKLNQSSSKTIKEK